MGDRLVNGWGEASRPPNSTRWILLWEGNFSETVEAGRRRARL